MKTVPMVALETRIMKKMFGNDIAWLTRNMALKWHWNGLSKRIVKGR